MAAAMAHDGGAAGQSDVAALGYKIKTLRTVALSALWLFVVVGGALLMS